FGQVSQAPTGTGFVAIASGYYHSYALRSDGTIVAWGDDRYGQVSLTPTKSGFSKIAAGGYQGYAIVPEPSSAMIAILLLGQPVVGKLISRRRNLIARRKEVDC
ncbi:MAG: hypothetical protein RL069_2591, partial [Planctomycetota bacterium]